MIEPYQVVGLMPTIRGIRQREEIGWNLDHIAQLSRRQAGCPAWIYEVQNRARALDNNVHLIANNLGTYYLDRHTAVPIDPGGGNSTIVDYKGQIVGRLGHNGGSTWVAGTIDIEALQRFRASAERDNWLKDLTPSSTSSSTSSRCIPRTCT